MSNDKQSFLLPSREKLEDRGDFFAELKNYLEDMQADAWHSRRELRAFRLLLGQLGGSVKLDLKGNANPPNHLHMGFDGVVAVSDRELDEIKNPISVRLLAQAPSMLESLKDVLKALDRGDAIDVAGIRRLVKIAEEAI